MYSHVIYKSTLIGYTMINFVCEKHRPYYLTLTIEHNLKLMKTNIEHNLKITKKEFYKT